MKFKRTKIAAFNTIPRKTTSLCDVCPKMATRQVLATVGTTKFDLFISTICSPEALCVLRQRGYKKLLLQIGNGNFIPEAGIYEGIEVNYYRFKDSILQDIENSALVISHAGAGSCLEVLDAGKPLVVVINEALMDNHQSELAKQLFVDKHAYYCTCAELSRTLQSMDLNVLKKFPRGNPEKFVYFLNDFFGLSNVNKTSY